MKFLYASILVLAIVTSFARAQRGRLRRGTVDFPNPRYLMERSMSMGWSDNRYGGTAQYAEGECEICSQENKIRPGILTMKYIGGIGAISKYQDADKATCRDQSFPNVTDISAYGVTYSVQDGDVFTIGQEDMRMDAETYFTFSGSSIECYIHTSCSQPLVVGDQIGPFLLLEGNDCSLPLCGDGSLDPGETCEPVGAVMEGTGALCRDDCTYCGDGLLNGDEECDEGDAMPSSSCRDCAIPLCGDGIRDNDETCDPPGKAMSGGVGTKCRDDCTYCGDGVRNGDEECDEGGNMPSPSCRDCRIPRCGDGFMDQSETCDPPGSLVLNGVGECRDDCNYCGDGIKNGYEECDEGGAMPSQRCRDCIVPRCGDEIMDQGETCEPPGKWMGGMNGECRNDCTYCGDGIRNGDEECDHGNDMPSPKCKACRVPYCGDETTDENETCDPPGSMGGKCRNDCFYCGDGIINGDEECDDGEDSMPSLTCKSCQIPRCGDGITDENETCDPPGSMDGACRNDCSYCGDGVVDGGEECDEGANNMPSETCDGCVVPQCVCEARGSYDFSTGSVTLEFDFCGEAEPKEDDFIAIYPCDTTDLVMTDQRWFDEICSAQLKAVPNCEQFLLFLGYEKGKAYPAQSGTWMAFTCGSPGDGSDCQNKNNPNTVWPSSNVVTIDPDKYWNARWAFPFMGPTLETGCYKALIHRDISQAFSAPPYPSVCKDWYEAPFFIVSHA